MLALCDNMVEMQDTLVGYPIYPSLHHALVPITWPLSRCESYHMALGLVDYTTNNGVEAFNRVIKCGTSLPTPTPTATPHRHPPTGSSTNLPTPFNVPLTTACLTDCLVQSAHTLGTAELARHLTYTILVTYNERRWQKMCTGVMYYRHAVSGLVSALECLHYCWMHAQCYHHLPCPIGESPFSPQRFHSGFNKDSLSM